MQNTSNIIAFQGKQGAFSDLACRTVFPNMQTLPCTSFEAAFEAVRNNKAELAMIPVDNTIAGRVADVHHLLPKGDLYIIGEHFHPVSHNLLAIKGAKKENLKIVHSHIHALPQCQKIIKELGLEARVHSDTAGAAEFIAEKNDPTHASISSTLAAEIYNLEILQKDVQDHQSNTTRFLILSRDLHIPEDTQDTISSLMFEVRNIPASLYKSLGGFATNNLSMTKLESYVDKNFQGARFYCEVEGHPETDAFKNAIEELGFFAKDVRFLGTYPAHTFRKSA